MLCRRVAKGRHNSQGVTVSPGPAGRLPSPALSPVSGRSFSQPCVRSHAFHSLFIQPSRVMVVALAQN